MRKVLLSVIPIGLLAIVIWVAVRECQAHELTGLSFRPLPAAAATALMAINFFAVVFIWRMNLAHLGHVLALRVAISIYFLSNAGRYIPGKIWQIAGAVALARREGVPEEVTLSASAAGLLANILTGLLIGTLALWGQLTESALALSLFITLAVATAVLLCTPLFSKMMAIHTLITKRSVPRVHFSPAHMALLTLLNALRWLLCGLAFHLLILALVPDAEISLLVSVGAYPAAYTLGLLALIAPGGIGVREGVLVLILSDSLGAGMAAVVAAAARVWTTALEALFTGWAVWHFHSRMRS
ncbi:flippase-like domain-containing protein [Candidatus Sumerlaeota bacterium]|nr:flippase-like domain-containing protein [Candidatus Sumerlaeota bacterium]